MGRGMDGERRGSVEKGGEVETDQSGKVETRVVVDERTMKMKVDWVTE